MHDSRLHLTFFFSASAFTGCISISPFISLFGIPIGIANSTIRLQIYAIIAAVKKYKSRIKKNKKKHDKAVLPAKT